MTPLQQRVRDSGAVTPLLLHDSIPEPEDGFEDKVIQILGSGNHGKSSLYVILNTTLVRRYLRW